MWHDWKHPEAKDLTKQPNIFHFLDQIRISWMIDNLKNRMVKH